MNKLTTLTILTLVAGGSLFARGQADTTQFGRGIDNTEREAIELISLEGTVTEDSYGNLMIEGKNENYLLHRVPTLDMSLELGDLVAVEGFSQGAAYTKDKTDYLLFNVTLMTKEGETETIDMDRILSGRGRQGNSGNSHGGRDSQRSRSSMNHQDSSDNRSTMGSRDSQGERGDGINMRDAFLDLEESEEITLSGTISLDERNHPTMASGDKSYVLMMDRDTISANDIEGTSIQVTGYAGPSLYTTDGEDYYGFMVTQAVVNGETIEIDHTRDSLAHGSRGRR